MSNGKKATTLTELSRTSWIIISYNDNLDIITLVYKTLKYVKAAEYM